MQTSTQQLAQLIHRKVELLTLLKQLAQKQLGVISSEDTGLLLKLLAGKQSVVDQLQALERELAPFREEDPESRVWASPAERKRCQEEAQLVEQLLADVMELDTEGEGELVRRRDAAAEQLQGLHTSARAQRAYLQVPEAIAGGFDLVSER